MGKFSKNKGSSSDIYQLIADRNSGANRSNAPRQNPQARNPEYTRQGMDQDFPQSMNRHNQPQNTGRGMPQQSRNMGAAPQDVWNQVDSRQNAGRAVQNQPVAEEPRRRGPRLGSVIFYTIYFLFIFLFFVGTYFGLQWLSGWLMDYEAAQPTTKSQEIFASLFEDPDWAQLYDAAGIEDTAYEGKTQFVAYMEEKVGEQELSFMKTSAGERGKIKYFVTLGDQRIGAFTIIGESTGMTDIPDYQFGGVELYYEREESYLIRIGGNHTAYVNGVALDENHTIQISSTKADFTDNFLPLGLSGEKSYVQQITGLMTMPTVTVKDATGKELPVSYDEATRTFTAQTESNTISDEHKELALTAIKTYAEYGIKAASAKTLAKYFDPNGDAYDSITSTVLTWTKKNNGYSFSNDSITGYVRYSDDMFSVYASTELTIKLSDGGTQVKPINATLLFQKKNGTWKVIRMTNADLSEPVGEVRLTFMSGDTVLDSRFVKNDARTLETPVVSAPEGKVFAGWIMEVVNEDGSTGWNLVFTPDESGHVSIPNGTTLEPMTLVAYFEDAPGNTPAEEGAK